MILVRPARRHSNGHGRDTAALRKKSVGWKRLYHGLGIISATAPWWRAWCSRLRSSDRLVSKVIGSLGARLHKPPTMVRRTNRTGLDAIAAGLRRDGVAVF